MWRPLGTIWDHLEKFENFRCLVDFGRFLAIFGHFGGILGPVLPLDPPPKIEGGTGPNDTKTSPNGPNMGFGAILDHLEATFIHFGPFEKVKKKFDFDVIWSIFGHFWPILGIFGHFC